MKFENEKVRFLIFKGVYLAEKRVRPEKKFFSDDYNLEVSPHRFISSYRKNKYLLKKFVRGGEPPFFPHLKIPNRDLDIVCVNSI